MTVVRRNSLLVTDGSKTEITNKKEICWLANQSHTTTYYASIELYNLNTSKFRNRDFFVVSTFFPLSLAVKIL